MACICREQKRSADFRGLAETIRDARRHGVAGSTGRRHRSSRFRSRRPAGISVRAGSDRLRPRGPITPTWTCSNRSSKPNLQQAAAIVATFVYHAAMRDEKAPTGRAAEGAEVMTAAMKTPVASAGGSDRRDRRCQCAAIGPRHGYWTNKLARIFQANEITWCRGPFGPARWLTDGASSTTIEKRRYRPLRRRQRAREPCWFASARLVPTERQCAARNRRLCLVNRCEAAADLHQHSKGLAATTRAAITGLLDLDGRFRRRTRWRRSRIVADVCEVLARRHARRLRPRQQHLRRTARRRARRPADEGRLEIDDQRHLGFGSTRKRAQRSRRDSGGALTARTSPTGSSIPPGLAFSRSLEQHRHALSGRHEHSLSESGHARTRQPASAWCRRLGGRPRWIEDAGRPARHLPGTDVEWVDAGTVAIQQLNRLQNRDDCCWRTQDRAMCAASSATRSTTWVELIGRSSVDR